MVRFNVDKMERHLISYQIPLLLKGQSLIGTLKYVT